MGDVDVVRHVKAALHRCDLAAVAVRFRAEKSHVVAESFLLPLGMHITSATGCDSAEAANRLAERTLQSARSSLLHYREEADWCRKDKRYAGAVRAYEARAASLSRVLEEVSRG